MHIPYLDNAATTPVDPQVIEAMHEALGVAAAFGNPAASSHVYGRSAAALVDSARVLVAGLLGADAREIVFVSGATEANNLALKGVAERHPGGHIVTSAIEHPSVLAVCAHLESRGHAVTRVAPTAAGRIEAGDVAAALRDDTCLVSVQHANNETGVIHDLPGIAELCREHGTALHCDAAQTVGKRSIDLDQLPVDLLSLSAHKLYGPKGTGALYVRRRKGLRLTPQLHGGGQEGGLRSGTVATHQVVGLGAACALASERMAADRVQVAALRDQLQAGLMALGGVHVNGGGERLAGHLNLYVEGVDGESLLQALARVAVSSGSACTAASRQPSHVLRAMGRDDAAAHASLRLSLGRQNTAADIDAALAHITQVVRGLRG